MGHGGRTCPLHFYKWLGTGGTVSRRTANKKTEQTVLTITKALIKTTNCAFRAKKWRSTTKKIFRRFAPGRCPSPLSNSFWCHALMKSVVLAIINIIYAILKMLMMMMTMI